MHALTQHEPLTVVTTVVLPGRNGQKVKCLFCYKQDFSHCVIFSFQHLQTQALSMFVCCYLPLVIIPEKISKAEFDGEEL